MGPTPLTVISNLKSLKSSFESKQTNIKAQNNEETIKSQLNSVKLEPETKEPKITPNVIKESIKDDPNKAFDISNYLNAISKKQPQP